MVHNYRWRLGLAQGEPRYDDLEKRLAQFPVISVPTITLEADANGAPHPDPSAYASKFSGRYWHRHINGGIGHNLPQEAPRAFAQAVVDADGYAQIMKAKPLFLAAMLGLAAPIDALAEDMRFDGATAWLNSPALTAAELRGKVVLIDFWTYTCINWLRTLPYVRAWAEKYKDQGLVVIGVHTPEFEFEKNLDNVRRAAKDMRVAYPVAIDSDYAVWRAFATTPGPPSISSMRRGASGTAISAKANTSVGNDDSTITRRGGSRQRVAADLVSVDARGAEAAADWGSLKSPENYVGMSAPRTLRLRAARSWASRVYAAPARLGSIIGLSRAIGR